MKNILAALLAFFLAVPAFATDILVLTNEMTFEGKIVRIKDCSVVFKAEGVKYDIPAGDIYYIQFEDVKDKVYTRYLKLLQNDKDKCLRAQTDASLLHGKKGGHFILGFLFGPIAMVGTALSNPLPHRGKNTYLHSQNRHLFKDPVYLKCYMRRARGQLIGMEALGWASWIVIFLVFINAG